MIVVDHVGVMSEDRSLLPRLHSDSFGVKVAEFIASRFEAAGYPVIAMDHTRFRDLPEGVSQPDVLYVSFRLDLSSVQLANGTAATVGTVSMSYYRWERSLLSWMPMTHFVVEDGQPSLAQRAQQARFEQSQKSVVDQIVYLKKRGF
jgi:hypothetical protein